MHTLNLDPNFVLFNTQSDLSVKIFNFSGGEVHVKRTDNIGKCDEVRITHRINSSDDLMELLLAADGLRRQNPDVVLHAVIPYFPYARQDRVIVDGEPFSLEVFIRVLETAKFQSITIFDPHSQKTLAYLHDWGFHVNQLLNLYLVEAQKAIKEQFGDFILISPDKGAKEKIFDNAKFIGYKGKIYCADKVRDGNTGKILGMSLECEEGELEGKVAWVADDICDGGRTFIEIAKILRNKGCKNVVLSVSHGIFSAGEEELSKWIDMIYTTNSVKDDESALIKRFKL